MQVAIYGPHHMAVANPLLRIPWNPNPMMFVDMHDPRIMVTASKTDDRQWLCVNKWDMEKEKYDKTVMVGIRG